MKRRRGREGARNAHAKDLNFKFSHGSCVTKFRTMALTSQMLDESAIFSMDTRSYSATEQESRFLPPCGFAMFCG